MPKSISGRILRPGEWIKNYFLTHSNNPDYIMSMYRQYKQDAIDIKYKPPKYESFVNYIHLLYRLELIERVKTDTSPHPNTFPRSYYKLTVKNRDQPGWEAPWEYLYGNRKGEAKWL